MNNYEGGSPTVVGVLQARMGSTRLPGKVLHPLAGRSVLGWVVRAVRVADCLDELIVATTTDSDDAPIVAECERLGVAVARGDADDVLGRFLTATENLKPDAIARFTADCPLLDPTLVAASVASWRAAPWLDYVSTAMPRCVPRGMDVEVVRGEALRELDGIAEAHHRTHVTSGIYTNPGRYQLLGLGIQPNAADLRVTLDTTDDLAMLEAMVAELGDRPAALPEVVAFLRSRPEMVELNAHVEQKVLEAG
ncbi:MAG: NTP transferase domain-containing protein [Streptosporangiales bacterium]|nr:NTP transferase domain-containing protein [Streptosporangiales bacterium]